MLLSFPRQKIRNTIRVKKIEFIVVHAKNMNE